MFQRGFCFFVLSSLREWYFGRLAQRHSAGSGLGSAVPLWNWIWPHSLAFLGSSQLTHREAEGGHLASLAPVMCGGVIPVQQQGTQRLNEETEI